MSSIPSLPIRSLLVLLLLASTARADRTLTMIHHGFLLDSADQVAPVIESFLVDGGKST